MTSQNFMIGPIKDGLRKDLKPFATPEDSFTVMTNAYQWRGRIKRRQGYTLLGNLANGTPVMGLRTQENFGLDLQTLIAFDTTKAYFWNGSAFVDLPSAMPVIWSGTNYQFFNTINYAGAFWATNSNAGLNGVAVTSATPGAGITTIITSSHHGFTTGQYVTFINITGNGPNGADDLNAYFSNTIMGGFPITVIDVVTFTIPYATTSGIGSGGFVLNSQVQTTGQDGIRYYGILEGGITGWVNYNPPVDPNTALAGCLLMFAYRGYLVFLNTWEGNNPGNLFNYGNRARWTQIGTPYYSHPVPVVPNIQGVDSRAARDDLFGKGGASDAPTSEVIIGADFIRDILIVYFERSTWRLRFVNNAQNPFVWERVNQELGASCTGSTIKFDKGLMAIGNRGIVISDGNDTTRFDEKIPDEAFEIRQANNGFQRVQGIRTFQTKLNYWTIPDVENPTGTFPDKVLVFNYDTGNWSYFDDCFTCFGYFYPTGNPLRWIDLPDAWSSYTDVAWNSGINEVGYESVVAGNQQGFVFRLDEGGMQNAPSLNITAISGMQFTSPNNNLPDGTWVTLSGVTGTTSDDGVSLNGRNFQFNNPTLATNTFMLSEYQAIPGGNAVGTSYSYTVSYSNILPGSFQINIGTLVFTDPNLDGNLMEASSMGTGTVNYATGFITLIFNPSISSTAVYIRCVSLDPTQPLTPINTTGAYTGGGQIAKISNIDIQTKFFNFFGVDQKARLNYIDFYLERTGFGQFTCNVFTDSSNVPANIDPANPNYNVVVSTQNPYQFGLGNETIDRLYVNILGQSVQLQMTMTNQQLAVNAYNNSNVEILAMIFNLRKAGRLI
jgi:hypothetical protein